MTGNFHRMRALAVCGAAAFAAQAHAADAPRHTAPDGRPLTLTFFDEFDHPGLNGDPSPSRWRTTFGNGTMMGLAARTIPTNHEREFYVDRSLSPDLDPFRIGNGTLDIVARPTPPEMIPLIHGYAYTSGIISSQPSFSQLYGYFEIRAKIPGGKGVWPAFWLLPADGTWPPEIDVVESVGDPSTIYTATHSTVRAPKGGSAHIAPGEFHTFAVSWDASNVIFYVDGKEIDEQTTPSDMHKPMFVLANLAIGGDWPGDPDAGTHFPVTFRIDYIRAYEFAHD